MKKLKNWVKEKRGDGEHDDEEPTPSDLGGSSSSPLPPDISQQNPFVEGVLPDMSEVLDEDELFRMQMQMALEQSAKEAAEAGVPLQIAGASAPPDDDGHNADGQAMACRYWVSGELEYDEGVVDGFYDIWGELPPGSGDDSGRLPGVGELRRIPPPTSMPSEGGALLEVLLVDHGRDSALVALEQAARVAVPGVEVAPEARAVALADIVAGHMGGAIEGGDAMLSRSWMESTFEMQRAAGTVVAQLGEVAYGMSRHRALLFKVLADHVLLPCRLLRGGLSEQDEDVASVVISSEAGRAMVVDLMMMPGELSPLDPDADPPPPASSAGGGGGDMDPRVLQLMEEHEVLESEEVLSAAILVNNDMSLADAMCTVMETTGLKANEAFSWCEANGWLVDRVVAAYFDSMSSGGPPTARPTTPNWGAPYPTAGATMMYGMSGEGGGAGFGAAAAAAAGGGGGGWWQDATPEGMEARRMRELRMEEERIRSDQARREDRRRAELARQEEAAATAARAAEEERMAEEARRIMRESKMRAQEEHRRAEAAKRSEASRAAHDQARAAGGEGGAGAEGPAWSQPDPYGRPPPDRRGSTGGVGGSRNASFSGEGASAFQRSDSGNRVYQRTPSGNYEFGQGWFGAAPNQQAATGECRECGSAGGGRSGLIRPDNGLCGHCHRVRLETQTRRAARQNSRSNSRRGSAAGADGNMGAGAGAGGVGAAGDAAEREAAAAREIFREVRERNRASAAASAGGVGAGGGEPVNKRVAEIREKVREEEQLEKVKARLRQDIAADITRRTQAHDLVSVMRMFGIEVQGSPNPTAAQVRKAYHQAAKLFHPDRQKGKHLRDQVHCEEIFKCIQKKVDEHHG